MNRGIRAIRPDLYSDFFREGQEYFLKDFFSASNFYYITERFRNHNQLARKQNLNYLAKLTWQLQSENSL